MYHGNGIPSSSSVQLRKSWTLKKVYLPRQVEQPPQGVSCDAPKFVRHTRDSTPCIPGTEAVIHRLEKVGCYPAYPRTTCLGIWWVSTSWPILSFAARRTFGCQLLLAAETRREGLSVLERVRPRRMLQVVSAPSNLSVGTPTSVLRRFDRVGTHA